MTNFGDTEIENAVLVAAYGIEVIGVLLLILGFLAASASAARQYVNGPRDDLFRRYRRHLAQSMMIGLEFLVAGDIISTVLVRHSLQDLLGLGIVVAIRTVLVFTIHLEVEGCWPWKQNAERTPKEQAR